MDQNQAAQAEEAVQEDVQEAEQTAAEQTADEAVDERSGGVLPVVALVIGIVSLVCFWIPVFPIVTALAGFILAFVAVRQKHRKAALSKAAAAISAIAFVLALVWFIYVYFVMAK